MALCKQINNNDPIIKLFEIDFNYLSSETFFHYISDIVGNKTLWISVHFDPFDKDTLNSYEEKMAPLVFNKNYIFTDYGRIIDKYIYSLVFIIKLKQ